MRATPILWSLSQAAVGVGLVVLLAVGPPAAKDAALELTVAYVALVIALQTFVLAHLLTRGEVSIASLTTTAVERFSSTLRRSIDRLADTVSHTSEIAEVEGKLSGELWECATRKVNMLVRQLREISKGAIPLTRAEYYDNIIAEMDGMGDGCEALAINYIDESRWGVRVTGDPHQARYLKANVEAIRRGATIRRVFILTRRMSGERNVEAVRSQKEIGVNAKFIRDHEMLEQDLKRDVVLFRHTDRSVAYEDFCDPVDPNRVLRGTKYVSKDEIARIENLCRKALDMAQDI